MNACHPGARSAIGSIVVISLLFLAGCTFIDDYNIDLMQDATASIESSSSVSSADSKTKSSSSHEKSASSSSREESASSSSREDKESSSSSNKEKTSSSSDKQSSSSLEAVSSSSNEEKSSSSKDESSSSAASSSSVSGFVCGDSTMTRGGIEYETVEIHNLCWTKKNLEFKPSSGDGYTCYNGDESNCSKYGMLYNYETASGVCTGKWRLPTQQELKDLVEYIDEFSGEVPGAYLKAKDGWTGDVGGGNDELGFTALPGGHCDEDKDCYAIGAVGLWWTSTEKTRTKQYVLKLSGDDDALYAESYQDKTGFYSVRCVRE